VFSSLLPEIDALLATSILLDILAKVGREDTTNGAMAFVCVSTNEKCPVVWAAG